MFVFQQKTAYEMRISDWSSDVCSSDLLLNILLPGDIFDLQVLVAAEADHSVVTVTDGSLYAVAPAAVRKMLAGSGPLTMAFWRSEERRVGHEWVSPGRSRWSPTH